MTDFLYGEIELAAATGIECETVAWYLANTDWCADVLDGTIAPARQGVLR